MLKLFCNKNCLSEKKWILNLLLNEYLGVTFSLSLHNKQTIEICYGGKSVILPDLFFENASLNWLKAETLPSSPLAKWNIKDSVFNREFIGLPILYGTPNYHCSAASLTLGIDIFGSAFFMLSRYEELVISEKDIHGRFPAYASLAFKEGFLNRPIINEYIEVLWDSFRVMWPQIQRKKRDARTLVSCDVDVPSLNHEMTLPSYFRRIGGDLIKRKSLKKAMETSFKYLKRGKKCAFDDPFYSKFKWMMNKNEEVGNKIAFYFIAYRSSFKMDGTYSLREPEIKQLMHSIHERGHEIGIHGGYHTHDHLTKAQKGILYLKKIMKELAIEQETMGGRQHYLRWHTPHTARILEKLSLNYDTSLSFADSPGFRCGICYEYPLYDLLHRRKMEIIERPLIVMECSVIANQYLGLGYTEDAIQLMIDLKKQCYKFNGDFTLLWHNSHFQNDKDLEFYQLLIKPYL